MNDDFDPNVYPCCGNSEYCNCDGQLEEAQEIEIPLGNELEACYPDDTPLGDLYGNGFDNE